MYTNQPPGAKNSNNYNISCTGNNPEQVSPATNTGLWKPAPAPAQSYLTQHASFSHQDKTALSQKNIQYIAPQLTSHERLEQRRMEKELQFKMDEELEMDKELPLRNKYDRIRNNSSSSLKRFRRAETPWMMSQSEYRPDSTQSGRSDSPCERSDSPTIFFPFNTPAQVIAEKLTHLHRCQSLGALSQAVQADISLAARTPISASNTPLSSSPADRDTTVSESEQPEFNSPRYKAFRRKNKPSPLSKS